MPAHNRRRDTDGAYTGGDGAAGGDGDVGDGVNVHATADAGGGVVCPMLCAATENSQSISPRQASWYNMWNLTASRP